MKTNYIVLLLISLVMYALIHVIIKRKYNAIPKEFIKFYVLLLFVVVIYVAEFLLPYLPPRLYLLNTFFYVTLFITLVHYIQSEFQLKYSYYILIFLLFVACMPKILDIYYQDRVLNVYNKQLELQILNKNSSIRQQIITNCNSLNNKEFLLLMQQDIKVRNNLVIKTHIVPQELNSNPYVYNIQSLDWWSLCPYVKLYNLK